MAKKTDSNNFPIPVQTRLESWISTRPLTNVPHNGGLKNYESLEDDERRNASKRDAEMKRHSTSLSPAGLQNFIRSKICSSLPKVHQSQRSLFRLLINFCLIRAFEFNS